MITGRPGTDDLLGLTQGGRDSVTIYLPIPPPEPFWRPDPVKAALRDAMTVAVNRLVGRGRGHDIHTAIRRQFDEIVGPARFEGQSVALFLTTESATGFMLPDRIEFAVRVGDHFDLGPLLRAVTMAHHVYGLTITEHDWGLWEAPGAEPAQLLAGSTREAAASASGLRAATFEVYRWITSSPAYFLRRGLFVSRALTQAQHRLAGLDPDGTSLLVLFPDDAIADRGSFGGVVENARLGRPVEVVYGDADTLTPGRIGRELRRHRGRLVQQELSDRITRLRAENAAGHPSTSLPEIAMAAAAGRVRTFVYDADADHYGAIDSDGRFVPDQWGYDALARIAIDVLAVGGEAYAVTAEELRAGTMTGPVLAEIAYPASLR